MVGFFFIFGGGGRELPQKILKSDEETVTINWLRIDIFWLPAHILSFNIYNIILGAL